ncbi:arylesterase [Spongiibacter sp.]|uniref:arylesterase n=1 Tax=Spongiibacter sp. TaxID=2024860 RepID=UPI003567AB18
MASVSTYGDARSQNILLLGDSLSAGYGIDPDRGWATQLSNELGERYRLINASISGETTAGGLQRLPVLLAQTSPKIVIIELGGNDGLRGYPLASIRNNLKQLITLSGNSGADILLLGMRIPPNYGRRYSEGFAALYRELAEEHGVTLLPFFLDGVAGNPSLMQADGIHPNAQAQPQLARAVSNTLTPLLQAPH